MGFRCPSCHKDFGYNEEQLYNHIKLNGACSAIAEISIKNIKKTTGEKKKKPISKKYRFISENHDFRKVNGVSNSDGSDNVVCLNCNLRAKRFMSNLVFDGRMSVNKIENCNN